ncbi:MAG: aminotransferase class III-fold pyridoxal phosphate-dependent enzyme [Desulfohalobiaceae bacterium]|nr:aminotransferase class III-fold pyridoxal phosphate-dependent enzyme [Desulfohalobiaceae bacterium]
MNQTDWLQYDVDQMVQGDRELLWHHLKPHKVFESKEQMIPVEAKGLMVKDIRGREYLDATSGGVWSVVVGFGRESMAKAISDQLIKMTYYAGALGNIPAIKLSKKILDYLPNQDRIFYSNSGSEANEKAYKMIRQLSHIDPERRGKYKVLFRNRDYHGTTIGALSSTGQSERRQHFGPFAEGFAEIPSALCYRCPFDLHYPGCDIRCAREAEEVILREGPDTVGGCIVEPITAGGGILPPVAEYYPILREICDKYGIYLIFDEVVCAFGRTGKFWGYEHYDVKPDMVTMAKGMASSYMPLSATTATNEIFAKFLNDPNDESDRLNFYRDISTYGGCAAAMSAGLENLRIIEDENLVERSRILGDYFLDRLKELSELPIVGDVRGKGLFCGLEFVRNKKTKEPISEAEMAKIMGDVAAEGVLVGRTNTSLPGNNTIMNFAPALCVTKEQLDRIVTAVKKALEKF